MTNQNLKISDDIEVRGEVYLPKKDFEALNKEREKKKLSLYANPRNIAAGSIRQLNPKIAAGRNLQFMTYTIATEIGLKRHSEEHELAEKLGLKANVKHNKVCRNLDEVFEYIKRWKKSE